MNARIDIDEDEEETLEEELKRIQKEDGEKPSFWELLWNEDRRYWV